MLLFFLKGLFFLCLFVFWKREKVRVVLTKVLPNSNVSDCRLSVFKFRIGYPKLFWSIRFIFNFSIQVIIEMQNGQYMSKNYQIQILKMKILCSKQTLIKACNINATACILCKLYITLILLDQSYLLLHCNKFCLLVCRAK